MKKEDLLQANVTELTDETFGKFTEGEAYSYKQFTFHVDGKIKREGASPLYEISLLDTSDEENEVKSYSLAIGDIKKKCGCTYKKEYKSSSTGKIVVLSEEDIQKAVDKKAEHFKTACEKVKSLLSEFAPFTSNDTPEDLTDEQEDNNRLYCYVSDALAAAHAEFMDKAELYYKKQAIEAQSKKEEAERKETAKKIDMSKLTPEQLAAILAIVNGK